MESPEKSGIWVSYLQPSAYVVRKAAGDKVRILIVDEHTTHKKSLRDIFDAAHDIEVVGEAANGEEALELAGNLKPDIVLMDIGTPSMSGIDATRALTDAYPGILVVLLTTFDDKEHLREARRVGASAYVMKDAGAGILLKTVHDVVSGETLFFEGDDRSIDTVSENHLTLVPTQSVGTGALITSNERTILKLLAEGRDNNQIAKQMGVPESMVRTYLAEICRKLGLSGREAAAQYARDNL